MSCSEMGRRGKKTENFILAHFYVAWTGDLSMAAAAAFCSEQILLLAEPFDFAAAVFGAQIKMANVLAFAAAVLPAIIPSSCNFLFFLKKDSADLTVASAPSSLSDLVIENLLQQCCCCCWPDTHSLSPPSLLPTLVVITDNVLSRREGQFLSFDTFREKRRRKRKRKRFRNTVYV